MFGEATPEERKKYYNEEWDGERLPPFIKERMEAREFAFDDRGEGPNNRYNAFQNVDKLSAHVRRTSPYAIYTSVSFYTTPQKREGWQGSELVFDVDARDQPVRRCACAEGEVCATCLEDAKEIALNVMRTLREDLGLRALTLVYSGRGYHVRVMDETIMGIEERGQIFDYVVGSKIPASGSSPEASRKEAVERFFDWLSMQKGYASVFRRMAALTFKKMSVRHIKSGRASVLLSKREEILKKLEERDRVGLISMRGFSVESLMAFLEEVAGINAGIVDGKVTVDLKRILRLPTSLHSKVSMVCMVVEDPGKFDPLRDAVPRFVKERKE